LPPLGRGRDAPVALAAPLLEVAPSITSTALLNGRVCTVHRGADGRWMLLRGAFTIDAALEHELRKEGLRSGTRADGERRLSNARVLAERLSPELRAAQQRQEAGARAAHPDTACSHGCAEQRAAAVAALRLFDPSLCSGLSDAAVAGRLHSSLRPAVRGAQCSLACPLSCVCRAQERLDTPASATEQLGHTECGFVSVIPVLQRGVGTEVDCAPPPSADAVRARIQLFQPGWAGEAAAVRDAATLFGAVEMRRRLRPCALEVNPGDIIILDPYLLHAGPAAVGGRATAFWAYPGAGMSRLYAGCDHVFGWERALRLGLGRLAAHLLRDVTDIASVYARFPGLSTAMKAAASAELALRGQAALLEVAAGAAAASDLAEAHRVDAAAAAWVDARARLASKGAELVRCYTERVLVLQDA